MTHDSTRQADSEGIGHRRVGLLVTCLVDLFSPRVAFASVKLLEDAGFDVDVPAQGCCGQANFNGGDRAGARAMALGMTRTFADHDYVVAPSGSCAATVRCHYSELFARGSAERAAAQALADKTYELATFLHDVAGVRELSVSLPASVTYHDACSGLRELGIAEQPRRLLQGVAGVRLVEHAGAETCCGFGGTFCVKYPEVSDRIVERKVGDIVATGADYVLAGDLGCLMNIEGKLRRIGAPVRARHVAEVLAGVAEPDHE